MYRIDVATRRRFNAHTDDTRQRAEQLLGARNVDRGRTVRPTASTGCGLEDRHGHVLSRVEVQKSEQKLRSGLRISPGRYQGCKLGRALT